MTGPYQAAMIDQTYHQWPTVLMQFSNEWVYDLGGEVVGLADGKAGETGNPTCVVLFWLPGDPKAPPNTAVPMPPLPKGVTLVEYEDEV